MKKVLIITYYWPPSGGPGVQRVLKFVKYLSSFGWQPIVMTVKNGNYPSIDESLVKEIPKTCKVFKTDIFEPINFYKSLTGKKKESIPTFVLSKSGKESLAEKLSKWVRANIFIPDAKIGWAKYIVKEGLKIIEAEKPDLIFSSSPPHSLQIGAMRLAKKTKISWVADFRDPWTNAFWQNDISRNIFSSLLDKRFEKLVFKNADGITTVSKTIGDFIFQMTKGNVHVLSNGFDESDFVFPKSQNDKFRITYTGTLGKDQSVLSFIKSIEQLPQNILSQVEINFIGSFHDAILDEIKSSAISGLFKVQNSVSHEESIKRITNSDLLLLIIPNTKNNKGILTGKLFEYLATGNPILCYAPKDGDAAEIISETKSGQTFDYSENSSNFILDLFNKHKSNEQFHSDRIAINKYSRKVLTEKLSNIFDELI